MWLYFLSISFHVTMVPLPLLSFLKWGNPLPRAGKGVQHPVVRALERDHVHRAEEVTAFHSEFSHMPLCAHAHLPNQALRAHGTEASTLRKGPRAAHPGDMLFSGVHSGKNLKTKKNFEETFRGSSPGIWSTFLSARHPDRQQCSHPLTGIPTG